jgi:membrane fusion protein (multidrug efflux system)
MNEEVKDAPAANPKRRKFLLIIATVFAVLALGCLVLWLLVYSRRETTDDAYVAGDQVGVAAQTPGTVTEVLVDDTQRVTAGQLVVRLDPTDYDVALERAASTLAMRVRQTRQQTDQAEQTDSAVVSSLLELQRAEAELARRQPLVEQHAISTDELQQFVTAAAVARAALAASERQAAASHALVDGVSLDMNPAVQEARANFLQAWIAARRANVRAPVSGFVARRNVQLGQRVDAGQQLFTIIPLDKLWIDANFKEGQLRALRIGQPVKVQSDLYGGRQTFRGRVAGLGAGTGAAFALLPAQNASGNWIKVVQRVPVRIVLEARELAEHPLRIGLSTNVNVDTRDRSGPVLAATPAIQPMSSTAIYADDYAAAQRAADALIAGEPLTKP